MIQTKWPARLVIVRHGESEQNVAFESSIDDLVARQEMISDANVKLTPYGIWQGEQTGLFLRETDQFDFCFASPYVRTMQTGEAIISQLGYDLEILKEERLREKSFGDLHGLGVKRIHKEFPQEVLRRKRDGKYRYKPPNGESYVEIGERVHSFLGKLATKYVGKQVLVVTHQVPFKMFRALFQHLDEKEVLALEETPNCGMQEYVTDSENHDRLKLIGFNVIAYSPAELSLLS